MLEEQDRKKLDLIVKQMVGNKESDKSIQAVVNDFKSKYDKSPGPVTSTFHQSIGTLKSEQVKAEKEADKSLFKRTIKEIPKAAVQVGLGGPAQFLASAAEVPKTLMTGKASGKTYDLPGLDPFKSIQSEAQQHVEEGGSALGAIGLKGTKTLLGAAETIGLTKGIKAGSKALIETRNNAKIWNLIKPKLSATEQAQAVKSGQIARTGITRKITQLPDQEMVNATKPYLKTTDPLKATAQMQEGIVTEANKIRIGLNQSKAIWNRNELTGAINKIEKPHLLSGDIEKAFNKTLNLTLKEAEKASKSLDGLLDVRQNFDKIVGRQYPNLYSSDTMTPIKIAVLQTRRAINSLIESKLPESADKALFVNSLRKQSLLYDAIDNVAVKVPKIGTSVLSKFGSLRKGLIRGAEVILGYEGIKKLLGK